MTEELATALGDTGHRDVVVHAQGEGIVVRPMTLSQIHAIAPHIKDLSGVIAGDEDLMSAMFHRLDVVVAAVAVGINKPAEWVWATQPQELLELASAVLGVNMDFFSRVVAPALGAAKIRLAKQMAGRPKAPAGATSSPASGPAATPSPKSAS